MTMVRYFSLVSHFSWGIKHISSTALIPQPILLLKEKRRQLRFLNSLSFRRGPGRGFKIIPIPSTYPSPKGEEKTASFFKLPLLQERAGERF
ncbi:hypothetical protein BZG01_19950 [Labilibaculum manganireducens]|uniref:Uncharacterized protein n=1 Tax=Labilibaculum manganireducens TaxID=1940525 RepID=A0A2N3HSP5_9BACT|nr:hypothetical protein BZG01_19950 [Labilibaculum manganireducens]